MKLRYIFFISCLCLSFDALSQDAFEEIRLNPRLAAGSYCAYTPPEDIHDTKAPQGYKPFYISHYGRHGSRYHTLYACSMNYPSELLKADSLGVLTDAGKELLVQMLKVAKVHEGMCGELSVTGMQEQRIIGERMAARFPDVWKRDSIRYVSSNYSRCLMSMYSFDDGLRRGLPHLKTSTATGRKYFELLANACETDKSVSGKLSAWQKRIRTERFDTERLEALIFKTLPDGIDMQQVAKSIYIYGCACGALENELGEYIDLFSWFTPEELYTQWNIYSDVWYGRHCQSEEYGTCITDSAAPLLRSLVEAADAAVCTGSEVAADLRFGHEEGLMPLYCLMGMEKSGMRSVDGSHKDFPSSLMSPCSSNLQMVFYRNRTNDVLVKLLYNERETLIPALEAFDGPYYRWQDLRMHLLSCCDKDAAAFAGAEWKTTDLGEGACSMYAQIPMFGSMQSVSVVKYPSSAFRTGILHAPGEESTTPSSAGRDLKAKAVMNAGYFHVKERIPAVYFRAGKKILGHTHPTEVYRVDGIFGYRKKSGKQIEIAFSDTTSYSSVSGRWHTAMASGPMLMLDGRVVVPVIMGDRADGANVAAMMAEQKTGSKIRTHYSSAQFYDRRHPRSVIGSDDRGNIYLVVIDGRFKGQGDGASIWETAYICSLLGMTDAINLDGGGSSAIWTDKDGVINHPRDNKKFDHDGERAVPNLIYVY